MAFLLLCLLYEYFQLLVRKHCTIKITVKNFFSIEVHKVFKLYNNYLYLVVVTFFNRCSVTFMVTIIMFGDIDCYKYTYNYYNRDYINMQLNNVILNKLR